MSTWEDLDDTSSDEEIEEEEANFGLMADTTSEESESNYDEDVNVNGP